MKIRTFFAVLLCKLARGLLRLLRRGGTAFPGRVALKVYPQVLGVLSRGVRVILVTGTNGKTTSSRMIEQAFADAGLNYFANRSGANLISGITAEFAMHSTLTGRPKCQFAVIECDEAASKTVLKYLKPEVIVATNVFRDQLDRYGEITHTLNNIIEGIRHTPESVLCINADCSLIASIPEHVPNPVVRFGVNVPLGGDDLTEISDAPHCIHCKTEYVYDYRTYGHLAHFAARSAAITAKPRRSPSRRCRTSAWTRAMSPCPSVGGSTPYTSTFRRRTTSITPSARQLRCLRSASHRRRSCTRSARSAAALAAWRNSTCAAHPAA